MSPSLAEDLSRLQHIRDAAAEAVTFIEGKGREDLSNNRQLELALTRLVEIIGEAAGQVSSETRDLAPSIPWPKMRGMRNHLIHAYFDVSLDYLWQTVSMELPNLIREIDELIDNLTSR